MKSLIILLLHSVFVIKCESSLKLVFSDEFESNSLDYHKWERSQHNIQSECYDHSYLNCFTNNEKNLMVINGTLVLAAIRENYENKIYTSPMVTLKDDFTFGKLEIRAALPKGKQLRPVLELKPSDSDQIYESIDIMSNSMDKILNYLVQYSARSNFYNFTHQLEVEENLSDFNLYAVEWTELKITWFFNGKIVNTFDMNVFEGIENPFNKSFQLRIHLGVGGQYFPGQTLYERDAENWECSLFIIDYIRFYQNTTDETEILVPEQNKVTSSDICAIVMPTLRPKYIYKMTFSDEFEVDQIDEVNKWIIYKDFERCTSNFADLTCVNDDPLNFQIINGTLGLGVIRQTYLNKFYTTPKFATMGVFKYGKFEIRAALPNGKMIRPVIGLNSERISHKPLDNPFEIGFILILSRAVELIYGIDFQKNHKEVFIGNYSKLEEDLTQFNLYVVEWTDSQINFFLNGRLLRYIDIAKEFGNSYNPFTQMNMKLDFSIGLGGVYSNEEYFPGQILYESDVREWKCSLLLIDYVRIYQRVTEGSESIVSPKLPEPNYLTSTQICDQVMPKMRPRTVFWNLVYSDEFAGNSIDLDEWVVQGFNETICEYNEEYKYNCEMNGTSSIILVNGTMIILPIERKNSESQWNGTQIISRFKFTYGRIEIRAALPDAKSLKTGIQLYPSEKHNENSGKDGKMSVISNFESNLFYYGINFDFEDKMKFVGKYTQNTLNNQSLFDFHTYAIEWTEVEIRWIFDDKVLFKASIPQEIGDNYNPFNKPFNLVISLEPEGNKFEQDHLSKCPLLFIDYVKLYEIGYEEIKFNNSDYNLIGKSDLCQKYSPFYEKSVAKGSAFNLFWIIGISLSVIFLAVIPMNIFLFTRMKKRRMSLNKIKTKRDNQYDDVMVHDLNVYEDVSNVYDYEEIDNNNEIDPDRSYLQITNTTQDEPYVYMK